MTNYVLLDFLNIGGSEFMMIAVAILLLFGGKKLPELARGLGRGIREFNDASEGVKREIHRNINAVTSDLTDKEEEEIKKNKLHPEEEGSGISSAAEQEYSRKAQEEYAGQPQTERFVPADQLEAERVIAERLAQTDRIAPEREQTASEGTSENNAVHEAKADNKDDSDEQTLKDSYA